MKSLRARLILAASFVLTVFILFAGYALDRAFYDSAQKNLHENLHTQLTLLMASTELTPENDIDMPARLLETKFSLPSSGLYAIIVDDKGNVVWKSLSTVGVKLPSPQTLEAGVQTLVKTQIDKEEFYTQSYGINWYTPKGQVPLTFNVISELHGFNQQIAGYRQTLWGWLFGLAAILLLAQLTILFWGLMPLRRVVTELNAIESGQQERITQNYPTEILRLTDNINGLLEHEHTQQTRYRHALADLAHSLKTPLAVLNGGLVELNDAKIKTQIEEQVQRMDHIIGHQLQRAATAGASPIRKSIQVEPILKKICHALAKVYQDKSIQFDHHLPPDLAVRVDEGDLMEVVGNIMDNACKWCTQRVRINIAMKQDRAMFTIADDGPGVDVEKIDLILQRGGRADQAMPGQGIGLSVVADIMSAYKGNISVTHSDLGGAAFAFDFPAS